ncbi:MAG: 3-dehydroquinate synthase [Chitinophagaceae bacterium]|nr:3-dehydroquinate synthase [Chitinophagaceae bacterium]
MKHKKVKIGQAQVDYFFDSNLTSLSRITDKKSTILVTDEHLVTAHPQKFSSWKTIVLKPGEKYKTQATVDDIVSQLIGLEADRNTTLVGVGGGVVTDLTGYLASVYMRGIRFGFVPTSILALVDASIGGKNGVDVGVFKNIVGTIRQPSFLLHDHRLLASLPEMEWINGFAEIIKHACIRDAAMFRELEDHSIPFFQRNKKALADLIRRNTLLKTKVVQLDEFEKNERRLLNFGHTLGHALENQYNLTHGQAVAIGMVFASRMSEKITGFRQAERVGRLIENYQLPTAISYDRDKVFEVLKMDKKRARKEMNYVLLQKIGKGVVHSLPLDYLRSQL